MIATHRRALVIAMSAAVLESVFMHFPPLIDIGPQPGDPIWYTALGYLWTVVHFPALLLMAVSFWTFWLIGFCVLTLILFASVQLWGIQPTWFGKGARWP